MSPAAGHVLELSIETLPWLQLLPCTFTGEQSPGEVCTYKRAPRAALQPPTPHAAYQHLWPTQTAAALPQDKDELSPGEDPTQCPRLGGLGNGVTRTRCCQYPLRSNPDPSTPQTARRHLRHQEEQPNPSKGCEGAGWPLLEAGHNRDPSAGLLGLLTHIPDSSTPYPHALKPRCLETR